MNYSLKTDGDSFEKIYSKLIIDVFPNYEIFWSKYITPWTKRDLVVVSDQTRINFRDNIPQFIEELCMAHYSVFRSLLYYPIELLRINMIKEAKNIDFENELLRSTYVHFSHAIEMACLVGIKILIIKKEITLIDNAFPKYKEDEEYIEGFKKYFSTGQFKNAKKEFEDKQFPISYPIQGLQYALREIVKEKVQYKRISEYFYSVKDYRNRFIHSPIPGTLFTQDMISNQIRQNAIKKGSLKKYRYWTDVQHKNKRDPNDFIEIHDFLQKEFYEMKTVFNILWDNYIVEMSSIINEPKYQSLFSK